MGTIQKDYDYTQFKWKRENLICIEDYLNEAISKGETIGEEDGNGNIILSLSFLKKMFHAEVLQGWGGWYNPTEGYVALLIDNIQYGDNVTEAEIIYLPRIHYSLKNHNSFSTQANLLIDDGNATASELFLYIRLDAPENFCFYSFNSLDITKKYDAKQYPYYKYKINDIPYYRKYNGETLVTLRNKQNTATDWALLQKIDYCFLESGVVNEDFEKSMKGIDTSGSQIAYLSKLPNLLTGWRKDFTAENSIDGYRIGGGYINGYSKPQARDNNSIFKTTIDYYPTLNQNICDNGARKYWAFQGRPSLMLGTNWNDENLNGSIQVKNNLVKISNANGTATYPYEAIPTIIFIKREPYEIGRSSIIHKPVYSSINCELFKLECSTNSTSALQAVIDSTDYSYKVGPIEIVSNSTDTWNYNKYIGEYRCVGTYTGTGLRFQGSTTDNIENLNTVYFYFKSNTYGKYDVTVYYDLPVSPDEKGSLIRKIMDVNADFKYAANSIYTSQILSDVNSYLKMNLEKEVVKYYIDYDYKLKFYKIDLKQYPRFSYNTTGIILNGVTKLWNNLPWIENEQWQQEFCSTFFTAYDRSFNLSVMLQACNNNYNSLNDWNSINKTGNYSLSLGCRTTIRAHQIPTLTDTTSPSFVKSSQTAKSGTLTNCSVKVDETSFLSDNIRYLYVSTEGTMRPGVVPKFIGITDEQQKTWYINSNSGNVVIESPVGLSLGSNDALFSMWYSVQSNPAIAIWGGGSSEDSIISSQNNTLSTGSIWNHQETQTKEVVFKNVPYNTSYTYVLEQVSYSSNGIYGLNSELVKCRNNGSGGTIASIEITPQSYSNNAILSVEYKLTAYQPGKLEI